MKVQPVMADEVQTFKALITIHKVLQEGHPLALKEAQGHAGWVESLNRGAQGEGLRGFFVRSWRARVDADIGRLWTVDPRVCLLFTC